MNQDLKACQSQESRPALEGQNIATLRIGTWNVYHAFEGRLSAIWQIMADNEADIWVLTETHDDLKPRSCTYVAHAAPRPKNHSCIRPGSRWVSIWSKYHIEKISHRLADPERTAAALIDVGTRGKLLVYGTVLPWQGDRDKPGWLEHRRVIDEQCAEWLMLRQSYPLNPLCVIGDFNSDMVNGRRYGTMAGVLAIKRGLAACGSYCATEPSRFPIGKLKVLAIDHVARPLEWLHKSSVVAAWPADKSKVSDHSGMIVEVSF